jgi:ribonuclease BN (tRNA processing enzyme)
MHFTALGVGDAFSAKYYSSCLLIEHEGEKILFDCPHPIRKILKESRPEVDLNDIRATVITHLHADHSSGVEGLGFFNYFALKRHAILIGHNKVLSELWPKLSSSMSVLHIDHGMRLHGDYSYFQYEKIIEGQITAPLRVDPMKFTFECRRTIHHIPTYAWKIRAGGKTLALSADTAYDPKLIEWLDDDSDLIVHETNLGTHTPYEKLLQLPQRIKDKMYLIHYTDEFDCNASEIKCLKQGASYVVG